LDACIAVCAAIDVAHRYRISSSLRRAFFAGAVFANCSQGYFCFRILTIVHLPQGTLLAVAEARRKGCDDFAGILSER
jgi:hypothetical protein